MSYVCTDTDEISSTAKKQKQKKGQTNYFIDKTKSLAKPKQTIFTKSMDWKGIEYL